MQAAYAGYMHTIIPTYFSHPSQRESEADLYRRFLGKLSQDKADALAHQGIYSGKPINGYIKTPYSPIHKIDPSKQDLIVWLFERATSPNTSLRKLTKEAVERGLTNQKGHPITFKSVYNLLTNPFYAGYIRHQGRLLLGKHEQIVSCELFNRVQKGLRKRVC